MSKPLCVIAVLAYIMASASSLLASVVVSVVEQQMTAQPRLVPYTSEPSAQLIIETLPKLKGKKLTVDVAYGEQKLAEGQPVEGGGRSLVTVPLQLLPDGQSQVVCRLFERSRELCSAEATITKLPPKPNEVKIDHLTRGLVVEGLPYLPVSFYCNADIGSLPEQESVNGFNTIGPYWSVSRRRSPQSMAEIRERMDRCAAVGVRVNYDIKNKAEYLTGEEQIAAIREEVEAFRDHPALLCWYLSDEPELRRIPPEQLRTAYETIKQADPYHPVFICVAGIDSAPRYADAMDILLHDHYPVPHFGVAAVADRVDKGLRLVGQRMPVWFIPQVFGGGEFWYREPTAREVRVMTYLALVRGATGIQYFVRRPTIANPTSPVVWSECRTLAMEMSQLAPAILSSENAPRVVCKPGHLQAKAFLDRGMLYVIAVNPKNEPTPVRLKLEGSKFSGKADAIFDRRQVNVRGGTISDAIDGMDARIYRIALTPPPADDIQPDPHNLIANPSFEETVSAGTPAHCYILYGEDSNGSVLLDPRVARHGRQSVRMTVPAAATGFFVEPFAMKDPVVKVTEGSNRPWNFWIRYEPGVSYRISVWAKAATPGVKFRINDWNLNGLPGEFTLTTDWQRYEVTGVARRAKSYSSAGFQLIGPGTAWFDLFEVVRLGQGQTAGNNSNSGNSM